MSWYICVAVGVVGVFLYVRRKQITKALVVAHYETIYWLLGSAATFDDIIRRSKNKFLDRPKRSGEIAVVTGGSRGIGLEIVKRLLECDMHVIIGCRNVQAGLDAIESIRQQGITTGSAVVEELDTSSLRSVKKFATEVVSKNNQLHLLINNAGIMYVPYSLTEDDVESQLAVNYLGHAYLTHLLLPLLKETGEKSARYARIVHVSSCIHLVGTIHFGDLNYKNSQYMPNEAYSQSKLAQLMFSNALDRKLKEEEAKVSSLAVHPGIVNTELFNDTELKRLLPWLPKLLFKTPEEGARSILYCALSDSLETVGGVYVSNCQQTWASAYSSDVTKQNLLVWETMDMLKVSDFCGFAK